MNINKNINNFLLIWKVAQNLLNRVNVQLEYVFVVGMYQT